MLRMRRLIQTLFLLLVLPALSSGQSLHFQSRDIDLGEVRNWGLQPAVFHFENRGNAPVFILRTPPGPDFRIIWPAAYVQPGASDSLVVYLIPKEKGNMASSFEVYGSDSGKPYRLSVRGNIMSLDECPGSEANVPDPARLIKVVEEGSAKLLPGASVDIQADRRNRISGRTDRKGQYTCSLRPGLYTVRVALDGYETRYEEFYLDRRTLILTFELKPLAQETAETIPDPLPDSIPALSPKVTPLPTASDSLDPKLLSHSLYKPNNIVFLLDVSSSMRSSDKLPLLKASIKRLVAVLRSYDRISLITYASQPRVLAEGWSGAEKEKLFLLIDSLEARGNTRGVTGMSKAYEIAALHFIPDANNIVIIATDGDFNGEEYSNSDLVRMISAKAQEGISLSVIGFGQGSSLDLRMRQMALVGKGSYIKMVDESQVVEEIMRGARR